MRNLEPGQSLCSDSAATSPAVDENARIASLNVFLKEWFGRHRDMHCYLAIDPSQRDWTSDDADDKPQFSELHRVDVDIDHGAFPEAHRPYLLKLDLATPIGVNALAHSVRVAYEDRRPESMAEGLGQRVGGWLASRASPEEVAMYWSMLALQCDDNGRTCVLRFYDSRAMALIWGTLSRMQRQAMLGPVRAWHVLDASATPKLHLASSEPRPDFVLSAAQWQKIQRHGFVNRALALHARAYCRQPAPGEIETAIAAAERAERYRLTDRDDWVAFIGHALTWHPQFDFHPKVLLLLKNKADDDFYTSVIGQLTADDIDEIQQGSWHEHLAAPAPAKAQHAHGIDYDDNV